MEGPEESEDKTTECKKFNEEVCKPHEDMLPKQASNTMRLKREQMVRENKCLECFLYKPYCICEEVANRFSTVRNENRFPMHIHLFMHFKEWGRSSNTGKLMSLGLKDSCTTTIFGIVEDEKSLEERLTTEPSIILYPRSDAAPISSLKGWYADHKGKVNLVVIDSTWPQSSAMDKRLPASVQRVCIDEMVSGPSQFLNRKQSKTKTKVSTIEATVMALRGLDVQPDVLECFDAALRLGVDAVLRQGGKAPVYGHVLTPQPISAGNYTCPSIEKPNQCTICLKTRADGVNFRNVGARKRNNTEGELVAYRVWRCSGCQEYFHSEPIAPSETGRSLPDSIVSL